MYGIDTPKTINFDYQFLCAILQSILFIVELTHMKRYTQEVGYLYEPGIFDYCFEKWIMACVHGCKFESSWTSRVWVHNYITIIQK